MSNIYLPDPIYERLPKIYLLLAVLLAVLPLASVKWLVIAVLVVMAVRIRRRRQAYREAEQIRRAAARMEKYRVESKRPTSAESQNAVVVP